MSWTRRRLQFVTAGVVVVACFVVYLIIAPLPEAGPRETAAKLEWGTVLFGTIPTAIYVVAALLVLHFWRAGPGARLSAMDPPGRALAAAVATLPEHRRDWGAAMLAELAGVRGRSARWRFALSCAAAALWLPRIAAWPVLALLAAVAAAAVAAAGPAVGAAVPELGVFAVSFVGVVGALTLVAVSRSRRVRITTPAPTILVLAGVAAAIAMIVVFLRREPSAAGYLPPSAAVFLAAVLAGCLWFAIISPRSLAISRLAPYLGAGAALVYVVGMLLLSRIVTDPRLNPPLPPGEDTSLQDIVGLLGIFILLSWGPVLFFIPAAWAAMAGQSFRAGLQAGAWTIIAYLPLMLALWLHESLHVYAIGGGLLLDGVGSDGSGGVGRLGTNFGNVLFWCLGWVPVVGLALAVIGAAAGARLAQAPSHGATISR
jgi:hypothetical protein